jgi:hypothetical protein
VGRIEGVGAGLAVKSLMFVSSLYLGTGAVWWPSPPSPTLKQFVCAFWFRMLLSTVNNC